MPPNFATIGVLLSCLVCVSTPKHVKYRSACVDFNIPGFPDFWLGLKYANGTLFPS